MRQGSGGKHFPGPHVHLVAACKHPKSFVQSDLNLLKFQTKITEIMDFCLLVYLFDDDNGDDGDDDEVDDEDENECFIEKKS